MMDATARRTPWIELMVTLVIPTFILIQWSEPDRLGAMQALLLALAFPLAWGLRDFLYQRRINALAAMGLVSLLLTGGIGLLELDAGWLAVKEAAVPALIGLVVALSAYSRRPLVGLLLFNPTLLRVELIHEHLALRGNESAFTARLRTATWMIAGAFLFSAIMNYLLASWIVTSPAGTAAFNQELGRLSLLSYPMIALPSTLMMAAVLYYLVRTIRTLAGLDLAQVLRQ